MPVKAVPDGYHTATPHLILNGADEAIAFYVKAFGAEELFRLPMPDGKVMHAEIKIGDSIIMIADEFPDRGIVGPKTLGGSPISLMLYVADVDAAFQRAVDAGAVVRRPLADQFYGDRSGGIDDPFGHSWTLATRTADLTPEELTKRFNEMMGQHG